MFSQAPHQPGHAAQPRPQLRDAGSVRDNRIEFLLRGFGRRAFASLPLGKPCPPSPGDFLITPAVGVVGPRPEPQVEMVTLNGKGHDIDCENTG